LNLAQKSGSGEKVSWAVNANLGRILEAKRSYNAAITQYEAASFSVSDNVVASRILLRMAQCYITTGKASEAQIALQKAVTLDPENTAARSLLQLTMK
jgi:lipopolysaccharide biosynthesis regulator YciM